MHPFKYILGISWLLLTTTVTIGQQEEEPERSRRFALIEADNGESYLIGSLDSVVITQRMPTKREIRRGRRRMAKYTRLRYNVHKVYPSAVKVAGLMQEIDTELSHIADKKDQKAYTKEKEKNLFGSYEQDIRKMTRTQGKILIKLVHRETDNSMFHIIKEYKSGASALFWQSIGLIFGINLKVDYDPEEEKMIESIVSGLEHGGYNIAYKRYDYSLP